MTPQDYYNHLVAKYGVADYVAPVLSEDIMRNLSKEMGFSIDQPTLQRLMEYASRGRQPIIEQVVTEIENALPEPQRSKLRGRVFAGDFPTGDFNAHAIKVPEGTGYVFLLNVGLMHLIYDTAKILLSQAHWAKFDSQGNPVLGSETGDTEINDAEASSRIHEMIHKYVRFEKWTVPEKRFVIRDESRNKILAMVVLAADKFVLAHEFGHVILGHLDKNLERSLIVPEVGITVSVVNKDLNDEFDADLAAGALILNSLPKRIDDPLKALFVQVSVAGPFLLFELARLIETVENIKSTTHPPTMQRLQMLEHAFRKTLPDQAFSLSTSLVTTLRTFEKSL